MDLAFPEYGFWLLLVIPAVGLAVWFYFRSRNLKARWFSKSEYARSAPFLKLFFRIAAVILLCPAILGVYAGRTEQELVVKTRETYILLDVSASMLTEDLAPNRLEKTKTEIVRYIDHMKGDRIGLIVFTSNAYMQCPITEDHEALKMYLDIAGSSQFATSGTDFRPPMVLALKSLVRSYERKPNLSRSIILISDGEHFGDTSYQSVVRRLEEYEIKVFPVGVGTYEGGPVPDYVDGERKGFKKDSDGSLAVSYLVDDQLAELAETFGTRYHKIQKPFDSLEPVEEQIKLLSTAAADPRKEMVENNLYFLFAGAAVILLFASLLFLPVQKTNKDSDRSLMKNLP